MELSDRIYNYLGNCQIPFAVFLDLSKAFDTLDHNILLHKLDHYGIRGVAKQLFESYITNRQQFVQINDIRSKVITTNIDVPQGSVLGPILFNIYINDLHKCTNKFYIINYADDTTLISTINQFNNHGTGMNDTINNELRNVHNWLLAQRLSLNVNISAYCVCKGIFDIMRYTNKMYFCFKIFSNLLLFDIYIYIYFRYIKFKH